MKRFADQEFTYIGVNSDKDRLKASNRARDEELEWVNVWNGPKGTRGPLAESWGVNLWPSTFLLDRSGRIRFRSLRGAELVEKIELLLAEDGPR